MSSISTLHARGNQIALELAVCRQHSILDGERLRAQAKRSHLLIVRKLRIHRIESSLRLFRSDTSRNYRRKISAAVADDNDLLRSPADDERFLLRPFPEKSYGRSQEQSDS